MHVSEECHGEMLEYIGHGKPHDISADSKPNAPCAGVEVATTREPNRNNSGNQNRGLEQKSSRVGTAEVFDVRLPFIS